MEQNTEWLGFVSFRVGSLKRRPECVDPRDLCSREAKSADSVTKWFSFYIY